VEAVIDPNGDFIVGALRPGVLGSQSRTCVYCSKDAYFAPSGQQIIDEKGFQPVCMACAFLHGMTLAAQPTPRQRAEMYEDGHDPDELMRAVEATGLVTFQRKEESE
jgi:hypothetical protein